ncbi:MAG TPA: DUF5522 domain-containing protein [Candidatus Limnocylindrales bacterium]|jgi:hypothetical protein|nr:DUF5522 domain-containing protein [Candidatus Limnocylindrales bacterium]
MIEREPIEGIDYYTENGLVVFTAQYLRERGYCCTSGCRHCPYGFERENSVHTPGERKPSA